MVKKRKKVQWSVKLSALLNDAVKNYLDEQQDMNKTDLVNVALWDYLDKQSE